MKRRGRPRTPGLLTARELEVLDLLRDGLSNREIAERLGITLAGAKFHVSEIIGKLGVTSREEASQWPKLPALVLWTGRLRRPTPRYALAAVSAAAIMALVLAFIVLLSVRGGPETPRSTVAPAATATPTEADTPPPPEPEFRQFASADEVAAIATFPVLLPAELPAGVRITAIVYYKLGFRCPRQVDAGYCAHLHNDFVQIRYTADDGREFTLAQGYGGASGGGVGYMFAPFRFKGTVSIAGREAQWVRGHGRSGLFDPGGGQPVAESDWIDDAKLVLTWFESRDVNPTGTESPRCFSLFSQTLSLEQLISIAASIPLPTALRSTGDGC